MWRWSIVASAERSWPRSLVSDDDEVEGHEFLHATVSRCNIRIRSREPARGPRGGSDHAAEVTPNLWFDTEAEEAAGCYVSVFENARSVNVAHYTEAGPREAGMVKPSSSS